MRRLLRSPGTVIPAAILTIVVLFAVFGNFLTEHAYDASNLLKRNKPPVSAGGTWELPLGTDALPDAITALEQIVAGTANIELKPSAFPGAPKQHIVTIGRTSISFDPAGIREE